MYSRRRHGHWFLQGQYQMNYSRGLFGICYNPVQIYAGASIIPNNRVYSGNFDNFRNSDRGYFHNKQKYHGHSYRGSKRRLSKGSSQKLSHPSSCDKPNKGEDGSQKVETLSTEPKEAEQCKDGSLENKTYPPKLKDNEAAEDSFNQTASLPSAEVFAEELSETTEDLPTMEKQHPMLSQDTGTPAAQGSPEQMASFPSAAMPSAEHCWSGTTEKLLCVEENDFPLTKITGYHENSDRGQGSCVSTVNSINHQQILSNIRCVPVLVRNTNNKLNQSWKISDNLRGWAPEDCQDPPCSMNQDSKCDKVSEHNRVLVPSESLSHTQFSCDQKNDNRGLIERHSSSPKTNHSSGSKHSRINCTSLKLHTENSKSSWRKRCSSRSPQRKEHTSRPSQKQKHGSESPHRRECGSGSPHRKECHTRSHKRQKHDSGSHKQHHTSVSPHRQENNSRSPHRRENSYKRACYCYPHCKHNCSYSQKIPWDILPHFSGKIKGHHSPQVKRKISKVTHHDSPGSPTVKKKRKNEIEFEKPTKKKKTTLEKRMKSTKLEKQTTQDQVSGSHGETSTLPEASHDLLPVIPPVRTEETEQIQMEAKNENTSSPHQPSAGEKNSSSTMPWTPKDRSAAVLARKEAIEEAYLQVLLNFAGVATMLVEKAPCMQEAIDSALRANLRRIGDYYGWMLTSYIDSLAEAS